ncbi:MAG: MBL fold metallo-hydrolase [Nitrososphaerota archaeon]|nr:MBL fold metallo-hydrolase [Nitrososphaerota archaeon]
MYTDVRTSRHFTLQRLADGVYSAIASDGGWAICNAGAVDLGDRVLVFDTFVNQHVAEELKEMIGRLIGKPVSYVVNSHYHSDHVKGNQAFGGASIVATTKTLEVMAIAKKRYDTDSESIRKDVQRDLDSRLAHPEDPDMALFEGYDRGHLDGLPTLKYTLPDVTFDERMTFRGPKRTAEAITYGGGHTVSDSFLYLPEDKVAFMGDLLFVGCHPYIADGNPKELFRIFDRVEALDARVLVPGHGPVGSAKDIGENRSYVEELQRTAREVRDSGGGLDQAVAKPVGNPLREMEVASLPQRQPGVPLSGQPGIG